MTRPFVILALTVLTGCPNDTGTVDDTGPVDFQCDPVGADPEMGALLNAPLDADVEVIRKTPRHPGLPGPEDLP